MLTKASEDASGANLGAPGVEVRSDETRLLCRFSGPWITQTVAQIDGRMRELEGEGGKKRVALDLSAVDSIDTAGAWLIKRLATAFEQAGAQVSYHGVAPAAETLLVAVDDAAHQDVPPPPPGGPRGILGMFDKVGRSVFVLRDDFVMSMHILGSTIRGAQMKAGRGHAVNLASIFSHMDRMGIGAIPVVLLMSSIIGAIIAQQGAFQLRYFGAEIFVVDLVGILVLREIGVLLTAIMIAGRSGSAITAEIGSMKMREEIDALTVIGLNPVGVLVFPRLVALVIVLPCLTVASNFAALGGAIFVSQVYSGISPTTFIDRLRDAIDLSTILAGLIKAPFMALIIGIVSSVEGLKVGGSAESLGTHVTSSVVKSIFVVIVVDGLFAMFYAAIDF